MWFSRKESWSGLTYPPPGYLPNSGIEPGSLISPALAAAAKSLQLCLTLCSPPGSTVPGILQARTLEWVSLSFSNAWKWKVKVKSLIHVRLLAIPWTAAYQVPPSMGFSRQQYWSRVPLPSPLLRVMEDKCMLGFHGCSDGKESACNAGDSGSISGSGRSLGEGNGNPLQYSCLENSMDRGAWQAPVHGITKSRTRLSD